MANITDETLPLFLRPLLDKASEDIANQVSGQLDRFKKEELPSLLETSVVSALEKASGKPKPEEKEFDPTDPKQLIERAQKLRKAEMLASINMDDPESLEAAAAILQPTNPVTPTGAEGLMQTALQKAQQEVARLQSLLKGTNTETVGAELPIVPGGDGVQKQAELIKAMTDRINGRRKLAQTK